MKSEFGIGFDWGNWGFGFSTLREMRVITFGPVNVWWEDWARV